MRDGIGQELALIQQRDNALIELIDSRAREAKLRALMLEVARDIQREYPALARDIRGAIATEPKQWEAGHTITCGLNLGQGHGKCDCGLARKDNRP